MVITKVSNYRQNYYSAKDEIDGRFIVNPLLSRNRKDAGFHYVSFKRDSVLFCVTKNKELLLYAFAFVHIQNKYGN